MTTETRQETCEKRIDDARARRLSAIDELMTIAAGDFDLEDRDDLDTIRDADLEHLIEDGDSEVQEGAQEALWELPLSVETFTVVKVLLSTGGPADWLEAQIDSDGDIIRIEYVYQDWFDSARRTLSGPDFETADQFIRDVAALA